MPYHMHHQHARPEIVERAEALAVETVVNVVYVTAGSDDTPTSTTAAAKSYRRNGYPISNTRPAQLAAVATSSSSYVAPARQHRPDQTPSAAAASASAAVEAAGSAVLLPTGGAVPAASSTGVLLPTGGAVLAASSAQSTTLIPSTSSASSFVPTTPTGLVTGTYSFAPSGTDSNPWNYGSASPTGSAVDSVRTGTVDTPVTTAPSSSGLSVGAKAGIAVGSLLGVTILAALGLCIYALVKKRSHKEHKRLDDEKSEMNRKSQSVSSNGRQDAPRLSLRPVTQMFPAPGQQMSEKQAGNSLAVGAAGAARTRTPSPAGQPRANPFGDEGSDNAGISTPAAAAAAAPTPVTAKLDQMSQGSPQVDGQAFPGAPAGSRRNSPPGPGANNVHRVQLDFKPSMDDELELRAGSLVRMLHEYDDGWALCIRLDRSQQGVVPRTCISKLPVKPRPGPPPNMRGPPQQGRTRNGSNASSVRSAASNGPARPMPPPGARVRAQTNAPHRPQSPASFQGQESRARSNSDAMSSRRMTPPSPLSSSPTSSAPSSPPQGQAVPARKPVPGQAM